MFTTAVTIPAIVLAQWTDNTVPFPNDRTVKATGPASFTFGMGGVGCTGSQGELNAIAADPYMGTITTFTPHGGSTTGLLGACAITTITSTARALDC